MCYDMRAMKRNYENELDKVLKGLDGVPRLLLQGCCGPCSSYVLEVLTQYFDVTLFYYNPNIRPEAEYEKRLETVRQLLAQMKTPRPVKLMEPGLAGARSFCGRCTDWRANRKAAHGVRSASDCGWRRRRGSQKKAAMIFLVLRLRLAPIRMRND